MVVVGVWERGVKRERLQFSRSDYCAETTGNLKQLEETYA